MKPSFAHLPLRLDDVLTFEPTGAQFTVASQGGGTFVKPIQAKSCGPAMTLRLATRRLLGRSEPLDEEEDFWQYWFYDGRCLRHLLDDSHSERISNRPKR